MRRTIKAGNDLFITEDGGTIKNRKTGRVIKLHERCGVYFFKMSLLPPDQQKQNDEPPKTKGFGRQAA